LVLASIVFIIQPSVASNLDLAGSTTIQKRVLEPASTAISKATGLQVKVRGIGSGGGFKELMAGKIVASVASSPLVALLTKNGLSDDGTYQEHVIIEDTIVPIVNVKNAVEKLSWEQLAAIHTGKIKNWSEVGGNDCPIKVVTSHGGSATRKVFQDLVMKKAAYLKKKSEVKSTRQEVGRVAKSSCAIGAVSKAFVEQDTKNKDKIRIVQTAPIVRPLSFITKGDPTLEVKKLIDYLRTPEAREYFQ